MSDKNLAILEQIKALTMLETSQLFMISPTKPC